ncbi:hypothetical protein C7C46_13230 [Streptomyces tateyamensis]|uniref:Penicillin-binding protein n=1 Tax=Streptomyces tateyamensis TaxID=565073 RepID=A0A2V4NU99_9ACTN|nr:penicillin-binding transpeptidase domain-containing protein [Streptomyces tateyamensis]PYC80244.1 hypothetical protein C7C46_13230 [Streptomyces tateyamensis]
MVSKQDEPHELDEWNQPHERDELSSPHEQVAPFGPEDPEVDELDFQDPDFPDADLQESALQHPDFPDTDLLDTEPAVRRLSPRTRRTVTVVVAAATVGLLAVGGIAAYNLGSAVLGAPDRHAAAVSANTHPAGRPSADEARTAAGAFLADWSKGDLTSAGAVTDQPDKATSALSSLHDNLAYSSLTLALAPAAAYPSPSPGDPGVSVTLPFTVTMAFPNATAAPWSYTGELDLLRTTSGSTVVHWTEGVMHPSLGPKQYLKVAANSAPPVQYTDRNGRPLDAFPSLAPILLALKSGAAPTAQPSDDDSAANGRAVVAQDPATGKAVQLYVISAPPATQAQRLTIDANLQQAAEQAVNASSLGGLPTSLVAVEPSTGQVLAVANSKGDAFNRALLGKQEPGSTMKVITAAALLEAGDQPDTNVACPEQATSPRTWKNDFTGSFPDYTLTDDFAHSCNTAFIAESLSKLTPASIPTVAKEQFGLGLTWSLAPGVPNADTTVPTPASGDGRAAAAIGQGETSNALGMASVAATVQSGTFRQPILLAGQQQVSAPGSLPKAVAGGLRTMMAATATRGTAQEPMAGLSGQVGAKTGTAENGTPTPNSWFIAYRGNLAVAAEVEHGGHGAGAAGSAVAQVLRLGNGN